MSAPPESLLDRARQRAERFLASLPERPVGPVVDLAELRAALAAPLGAEGEDPASVLDRLAAACEPALVATAGPRYFGFVIGGSQPVAVAADWLTSAWDQNAGLFVASPAAAMVEDAVGSWLIDLLGLPRGASYGFVTGGQMANLTGLAAGRHRVLQRAGWDVERDGLIGAPPLRVLIGAEAHTTILVALRLLGLGAGRAERIAIDDQGRMRADDLARALAEREAPTIVCAQVGNVNSGAIDPVGEIAALCRSRRAWLHVDGAFGLWAAAVPSLRAPLVGFENADSWAMDFHKWLNVPYDSGIVFVADADAHRGAMSAKAAYLAAGEGAQRDNLDYVPELSRRARGFAAWAALRALGRNGIARLVESSCELARRFAANLAADPRAHVLNEVVLNQVLVRFAGRDAEDGDRLTRAVIARVQADGTCWLGGTEWHGRAAMRISVSNWSTTTEDVDRSAAAVLGALRAEAGT